ncbi:hyccin 2-like [Glandiceps talaboti]
MDARHVQELKEWIAECKSLSRQQLHCYGNTLKQDKEVNEAIYKVFESSENELRDSVCGQLFEFYRSQDPECKRFCLQYIPSILHYYLTTVAANRNRSTGRIEALLLAIYNLDLVNVDGTPKVRTFIIPTLAKPSVYHEPVHLSAVALTETALSSHQKGETHVIKCEPYPQEEVMTSQNRFSVLSHVLYIYNANIAKMPQPSHEILCKMCSRLCSTGYSKRQTGQSKTLSPSSSTDSVTVNGYHDKQPRIGLNPDFMVEMLNGIYFVMFNGQPQSGLAALEDIHERACQDLYSEVLMVTNAIKNSNPSGKPSDSPIGISISLTPSTPCVSRAAITNASFRARRLSRISDDVTITVPTDYRGDRVDGLKKDAPVKIDVEAVDVAIKQTTKSVIKVDTIVTTKVHEPKEEMELDPSANQARVMIAPASHSREITVSNASNTVEMGSSPGRMETRL